MCAMAAEPADPSEPPPAAYATPGCERAAPPVVGVSFGAPSPLLTSAPEAQRVPPQPAQGADRRASEPESGSSAALTDLSASEDRDHPIPPPLPAIPAPSEAELAVLVASLASRLDSEPPRESESSSARSAGCPGSSSPKEIPPPPESPEPSQSPTPPESPRPYDVSPLGVAIRRGNAAVRATSTPSVVPGMRHFHPGDNRRDVYQNERRRVRGPSVRDRAFLVAFVGKGGDPRRIVEAYDEVFPDRRELPAPRRRKAATKLLSRLSETPAFKETLEAVGLGDTRLMGMVDRLLRAKQVRTHVVAGAVLETAVPDNGTRMEATKLLAKLLGRDVQRTESTVRATHGVVVIPAELPLDQWMRAVHGEAHDAE